MKTTIKTDIFLIGLYPSNFVIILVLSVDHSCYTFRYKFTQYYNILQQILCQYNPGKTSSVIRQFCLVLVTYVMKFNHQWVMKRIVFAGLGEWPLSI